MEGGTYTTLIPVHTIDLAGEASTSMLFGFDYQDTVPHTVGLVPVLVEEPAGSSYRQKEVLSRWRQCFQWMFLSSQPDRLLDFGGEPLRNKDAYDNIRDSLKSAGRTLKDRNALGLTPFDDVFCNYLTALRVVPRRVVKSPCQACAEDGGWTMTLSWALWHPQKNDLFQRWNPVWPSKPESDAAKQTHDGDVFEYCSQVWLEFREELGDVIENARNLSYQQVCEQDEDGQLLTDVEEEAEKRMCASVAYQHQTLWYPPDWLLTSFAERFRTESAAVTELNPLVRRMLREAGLEDPYDIWGEGLKNETEGRMYGSQLPLDA